eukprot:COSAG03_NODE_14017_length_480_cov_0.669291_1_plen_106_part_01
MEDARVYSAQFEWEAAISSYDDGVRSLPDDEEFTVQELVAIRQTLEDGKHQALKDKKRRDDNRRNAQHAVEDSATAWKNCEWKTALETARSGLSRRCEAKDRGWSV